MQIIRFKKFILILIASIMMLQHNKMVLTQDDPVTQADLQGGATIFVLQNSQWLAWDVQTNQQTASMQLPILQNPFQANAETEALAESPQLISVGMDASTQFLYTIESTANDERGLKPAATQLVQTDRVSQERRVILEHPALFTFSISLNGDALFVIYFEGDYGGSRRYGCILDVTTGQCNHLDISLAPNIPVWVESDRVILLSEDRQLYSVDAANLELTPLPLTDEWAILSFTKVPDKATLLVSANPRQSTEMPPEVNFLMLDLNTIELSSLQYSAVESPYGSVDSWLFSPDGRYLLYGSTFNMALVEFETGALVSEFADVIQATWLPDSSGIVMHINTERPGSIIRFGLRSRETQTLTDNATGITLLN